MIFKTLINVNSNVTTSLLRPDFVMFSMDSPCVVQCPNPSCVPLYTTIVSFCVSRWVPRSLFVRLSLVFTDIGTSISKYACAEWIEILFYNYPLLGSIPPQYCKTRWLTNFMLTPGFSHFFCLCLCWCVFVLNTVCLFFFFFLFYLWVPHYLQSCLWCEVYMKIIMLVLVLMLMSWWKPDLRLVLTSAGANLKHKAVVV